MDIVTLLGVPNIQIKQEKYSDSTERESCEFKWMYSI